MFNKKIGKLENREIIIEDEKKIFQIMRETGENLKRQDQMRWVRLMNNVKAGAEEIVVREIIYV